MKFNVPLPIEEIDESKAIAKEVPKSQVPLLLSSLPGSEFMDNEIFSLLIEDYIRDGVKPGAVVVHKRFNISQRTDPIYWGIVTGFKRPLQAAVCPIVVKWVNGCIENCSDKELIFIHRATWADRHILESRVSDDPPKN